MFLGESEAHLLPVSTYPFSKRHTLKDKEEHGVNQLLWIGKVMKVVREKK